MRYSNFFSLNQILIKSFESKIKYSKDCWILMLYIPAYCPILQNYLVPWCCTIQILSIMYTDCESYCLLSGHLSFGPMRNIYCWIIGKLSCRCYILKKKSVDVHPNKQLAFHFIPLRLVILNKNLFSTKVRLRFIPIHYFFLNTARVYVRLSISIVLRVV